MKRRPMTPQIAEKINEMLANCQPINKTIGEAELLLHTLSGAEHRDKSLRYIFDLCGRFNKKIVARYALQKNGLAEADINMIFEHIDLNWYDSSIVEDIADICGVSFVKKGHGFWEEPMSFSQLRKR